VGTGKIIDLDLGLVTTLHGFEISHVCIVAYSHCKPIMTSCYISNCNCGTEVHNHKVFTIELQIS